MLNRIVSVGLRKPKVQPVTLRDHIKYRTQRNMKFFVAPAAYLLAVNMAEYTYKLIDPIQGIKF